MFEFKGFDDWVEIFRSGRQIDSAGCAHDGEGLIDQAVSSFNKNAHEPPLTVGHPRDNSPAFGWVEGLRKVAKNGANVLQAKFRQVVPEFEKAVKQGRYKKRSASFYPDGRLRHVGFLGAAPPAVKGLADLKFEETDDAIAFDFETQDNHKPKEETMFQNFKEFLEVFKFWQKLEKDPDATLPDPPNVKSKEKTFTEADVEAAKAEAAKAEAKKVKAEFAEKAAQAKREARSKEISTWCDTNLKDGKLAPAWVDAGLKEFMEGLEAGAAVEFSDEKSATPYEWFKEFMEGLPKVVEFKEIATKKKAPPEGNTEEQKAQLVQNYMEKNPKTSYRDALLTVSKDNPDIFRK